MLVREFMTNEGEKRRLEKAYVREVAIPGIAVAMQDQFHGEGFFSITTTPLGANLCLLDENQEDILQEMMEGSSKWLEERFKNVRRWSPREVDQEKLVWVKEAGIPRHAWTNRFLSSSLNLWKL